MEVREEVVVGAGIFALLLTTHRVFFWFFQGRLLMG